MNIPEKAIDAATAAIMVTEGRTENVRTLASRIVAAAAPHIAAQAWQEGFKQGGPMHDVNYDDPDAHRRNPYRSADA